MARKISPSRDPQVYAATKELLLKRVAHFNEARRIAEEHYDRLKAAPDWPEFCEAAGWTPEGDFGDLTC